MISENSRWVGDPELEHEDGDVKYQGEIVFQVIFTGEDKFE